MTWRTHWYADSANRGMLWIGQLMENRDVNLQASMNMISSFWISTYLHLTDSMFADTFEQIIHTS
jgi:hypothetical protein